MSEWAPVAFRETTTSARDLPTGREKSVEDDDPYELVGVRFPVPEGVDADAELARIFVEEYAVIGWSPQRIRELFAAPLFAGAHDLVRRRGQGIVDDAIATVFGESSEGRTV